MACGGKNYLADSENVQHPCAQKLRPGGKQLEAYW